MGPTLFDRSARAGIHERLDRLSPESVPHWGQMPARQMVCHVADQLRIAVGDTETGSRKIVVRLGRREVAASPGLLRFKTARHFLVHSLPWPRARVDAPPEMLRTLPGEWGADIAALHALVDRVGTRGPSEQWGIHPWFGVVSGQEWGLLCWRHLDHHLRQFGV